MIACVTPYDGLLIQYGLRKIVHLSFKKYLFSLNLKTIYYKPDFPLIFTLILLTAKLLQTVCMNI